MSKDLKHILGQIRRSGSYAAVREGLVRPLAAYPVIADALENLPGLLGWKDEIGGPTLMTIRGAGELALAELAVRADDNSAEEVILQRLAGALRKATQRLLRSGCVASEKDAIALPARAYRRGEEKAAREQVPQTVDEIAKLTGHRPQTVERGRRAHRVNRPEPLNERFIIYNEKSRTGHYGDYGRFPDDENDVRRRGDIAPDCETDADVTE